MYYLLPIYNIKVSITHTHTRTHTRKSNKIPNFLINKTLAKLFEIFLKFQLAAHKGRVNIMQKRNKEEYQEER